MRYDIHVLWIDDTDNYYNEMRELLETELDDDSIEVKFDYIQDVNIFEEKIKQEQDGFKVYDIIFVDFSLSSTPEYPGSKIFGNDVIRILRENQIDTDILFYSTQRADEVREEVQKNMASYEGVYVASRDDFDRKAYKLLKKNSRRLLSLLNIRGMLMDQTSENDYTMKSYILKKFASLKIEQQNDILAYVSSEISNFITQTQQIANDIIGGIAKYEEDKTRVNINKLMKESSIVFTTAMKYEVFKKMLEFDNKSFNDCTIDSYLNDIVKMRNKLAHKKLDICKKQKYIMFYDDIKQYEKYQCPSDCLEHTNQNKISLDKWIETRKKIISFGKNIDDLEAALMHETDHMK
jgi:hypothetical protein